MAFSQLSLNAQTEERREQEFLPNKIVQIGLTGGWNYRGSQTFQTTLALEEHSLNYTEPFKYHWNDKGFIVAYSKKLSNENRKNWGLYYTIGFNWAVQRATGAYQLNGETHHVVFKNRILNVYVSRFTIMTKKWMWHCSIWDGYWMKLIKKVDKSSSRFGDKLENTSGGLHIGAEYRFNPNISLGTQLYIPVNMAIGPQGYYRLNHIQLQLNYRFFKK